MDYKLKDTIELGQKFEYEYDYGSTTELTLKVDRYRVGGKKLDDDIEILSRNNPPQFICQNCKKNKAKWIIPEEVLFDDNIFWCNECFEKEGYAPEYALPICNSPRMGVCAYEGSNIYPEQFEPDVVDKAKEVKKEDNKEEKYKRDSKGRFYKQVDFDDYENKLEKRNNEDATIDQWRELYEIATRICELKPWEKILSKDIIAVKREFSEDVLYYKIIGFLERLRGIEIFEGEEAFNALLGNYGYESLNIPRDYAICSQKNISCYWSDREYLKEKQKKIIKELGYKYRGKGNWLDFVKAEPWFDFMTLNMEEVDSAIESLKILEKALEVYEKSDEKFSVHSNKIFYIELKKDGSLGECKFKPLLINNYVFEEITMENEDYRIVLKNKEADKGILELEIFIPDELYYDRNYNKYVSPVVCVFIDNKKIDYEVHINPSDDMIKSIAYEFISHIITKGKPKEVHVSNAILEVALREICRIAGIKLKLKKELSIDKM